MNKELNMYSTIFCTGGGVTYNLRKDFYDYSMIDSWGIDAPTIINAGSTLFAGSGGSVGRIWVVR